ncbi:hypothetical protein AJ79_01648 [Helicocarpus griseus UAMH5409]|uniref:F-box domain-containing protein n=1 Tax=Helicocarpus griseus UAMH5409 TaxID=1447875 RepID=A0A2B7Y6N4_9EURO|nr:hypothetical protein AJ79_01648 [Helicocarpus griseus UAMH5409]
MSWQKLPPEIIHQIVVGHCLRSDLPNLALVNKAFSKLIPVFLYRYAYFKIHGDLGNVDLFDRSITQSPELVRLT